MAGRSRGALEMLTRSAVPAAWCCPSSRWPPRGAGTRHRRSPPPPTSLGCRRSRSRPPSKSSAPRGHWPPKGIFRGRGPRCRLRPTSRVRLATAARRRGSCTTSRGSAIPSRSPTVSRSSASCVRARSCRRTRCTQLPPYPAAVQALLEAADAFEQLGALLFAAEATAEAARAFRRQGDARAAASSAVRAASLVEACEGARTPALAIPMAVSPLTARERDIATLAAQGMASKEIAEHLVLVGAHRQQPPAERVLQARRRRSTRARRGARRGQRREFGACSCRAPSIIVSAVRL